MKRIFIILIILLIPFKFLFSENIIKLNIKNGYNGNVLETKNREGSFYNELSVTNFYQIVTFPLTFLTDINFTKFYKGFKILTDITNEISYELKFTDIYCGFNYYRDENDEQNSFVGYYIGEDFSFKIFEFEYTFLYKDYLKPYIYGSYKGLREKGYLQHISHHKHSDKNSKKKNHGKGKGIESSHLKFSNIDFTLNSKSQYDKLHIFKMEIKNFSFYYLINKSNISLEDYETGEIEWNLTKDIDNFDYSFLFNIGRKRFKKSTRKDNFVYFELNVDYFFSEKIFFNTGIKIKNNNSNFEDEDFFKIDTWLSVGLSF